LRIYPKNLMLPSQKITFFVDDDLLYFMEQNDLPPYDDEIVRIVFF
jgi:hypothetical protein